MSRAIAALITHSHPPATTEAVAVAVARRAGGGLAAGRDPGRAREARRRRPTGVEAVE